jgi:rod shape-determining protein MreB and related proteins
MIKQLFNKIYGFFSTDIAMDLGTANTLLYITEKGIVLNEPSVVAVNLADQSVEAVGLEAKKMFGRTHSKVKTVRPMKDGVIADFDVTNKMIQYFIKKILHKYRFFKPKIVVGVPTCITQVEKKAVIDASLMSGVREVYLIEEPMAAAIGVGIPVHRPEGNMLIDIGGGTTDVAVISLSAIAYGESVRVAGDEIDESIVRYMRLQHHLKIGVFEAERVKLAFSGGALQQPTNLGIEVKGLNVKTGVPMSITIGDYDIGEALKEPLTIIVTSIMRALEKIPPELSADIHSNGIYLTGGGALIHGLDKMIEKRTTLKVFIPEDPLLSIVKGAGAVLDDFENMKKTCIN